MLGYRRRNPAQVVISAHGLIEPTRLKITRNRYSISALAALRRAWKVWRDLRPRNPCVQPTLMGRHNPSRVIERSRSHGHATLMLRRRTKDRRATCSAEVSRQRVAAISDLRKTFRRTRQHFEVFNGDWDGHTERAAGELATVRAMAIASWFKRARNDITH